MTRNTQDHWIQWLLHRRFGGDLQHGQAMLKELSVWRDRILEHATITEGETVLDVGCGDGLIAFGALDRVGKDGLVIFWLPWPMNSCNKGIRSCGRQPRR